MLSKQYFNVLKEKKDNKLILVTQGEEEDIHEDKKREIFAKGETGQPNSIITIKLTNISLMIICL